MPTFLLAFHGGTMPDTPDETAAVMAKWGAWFSDLGDAVTHKGAPLGPARMLSSDGDADDTAAPAMTGYIVVTADDMDAALGLARGCPSLDSGGVIRVAQEMKM